MNSINSFAQQDCYQAITGLTSNATYADMTLPQNIALLSVGDIIVYHSGDMSFNGSIISHSAVIVEINSNAIYVRSKWSEYGVYRHNVNDCPYSTAFYLDNQGGYYDQPAFVDVFHPSHTHKDNTILPTLTSSYVYTLPSYVTRDIDTHKAVCDCGRGYSIEYHNYVQLTLTRYKCYECGAIYDSSINNSLYGGNE